jgi:Right handed beta helix region
MRRHLLKIAIASAVLIPAFATAPAQAQATRTWVSGVGDDANPCSRTAPCKTFAGAISKTAGGGEINCLDPGGFGAVTITKSIKIDCLQFPGGILSAGVTGINVSITAGTKVILRGIEIEGAGTGVHGVSVNVPSEVSLEKMHISGITGNGVNVATTVAGTTNVIVMDTVITQAAKGVAMSATGGGVALAAIRNTNIFKVSGNGVSLDTSNTFATISNSMLTGNNNGAVAGASGSQLNLAKSMISYNATAGLSGVAGSTVRMTDNTFVNNTASTSVAGTFQSGGDNKLDIAGTAPGGMVNQ